MSEKKSVFQNYLYKITISMDNYDQLKEEIKEMIKDMIMNDDEIKEYDLLYRKKEDWNKAKKELRSDMVTLMKHLEDDEYQKGVILIDKVTDSLKKWKKRLQKQLD